MKTSHKNKPFWVSSEIGTLRKLLIHSPDGGIGKIIPSKFRDALYDDTVQLIKMQEEYSYYVRVLLYFLDPDKARALHAAPADVQKDMFKPDNPAFYNSEYVIEAQKLLGDILQNDILKMRIVSAISAVESCSQKIQSDLEALDGDELSKALITGVLSNKEGKQFIFPPIPNFVFTRDVGIMIKDHLLLSRTAKSARKRESILMKYMAYYGLFKHDTDKVIEIMEESDFFLEDELTQSKKVITIEGGDIMMISPNHLIVGCSERTSVGAVDAIIHRIFSAPELDIERISVVNISQDRAHMHIDTIFTQISRGAWVLYGYFSEELLKQEHERKKDFFSQHTHINDENISIYQYTKHKGRNYTPNGANVKCERLPGLEYLLRQISIYDFGVSENDVKIVYCANNEFPYNEREQWTDACNLLAVREGVVIGYDRNEKTIEAIQKQLHFTVVKAEDLIDKFDSGELKPEEVHNTLIVLPSNELSRARGGSHCMSCPLLRDDV